MSGSFQQAEISQEHREIATANAEAFGAKLGHEGTPEYKIVNVFEQVVAGKYFWFHLVNNSDGSEWSVCVFQPLGGGIENLEVAIAEEGHTEARNPN